MRWPPSRLESLETFADGETALYAVVGNVAHRLRRHEESVRDETLDLLGPLLAEGMIEAGRILVSARIDPRPWVPIDLPPTAILEMCGRLWDDGKVPDLLDDIWFVLTERGSETLAAELAAVVIPDVNEVIARMEALWIAPQGILYRWRHGEDVDGVADEVVRALDRLTLPDDCVPRRLVALTWMIPLILERQRQERLEAGIPTNDVDADVRDVHFALERLFGVPHG